MLLRLHPTLLLLLPPPNPQGKGAILDSGTTDTYLPKAIARDFKERFKTLTGIDYSEDDVVLTAQQIAKLPDLAFKFKTATGTIQVSYR